MDIETFYMTFRPFNRQTFNPTVIKHRNFDTHIATAKHCGTRWVKHMLGWAFSEYYDLKGPEHINDDSIIGHPKNKPLYPHIPQIAMTHSHPHYLMRIPGAYDSLGLPRYIVLVRNIKAILVSIYEKSKGDHLDKKMGLQDVDFKTYLKGDVTGRTRIEDIWGLIQFFNAWGAVQAARPDKVSVIHYEDLTSNTCDTMLEICRLIGIEDMKRETIERAVQNSSRKEMQKRLDPNESVYERAVSSKERNFMEWYDEEAHRFIDDICTRHLRYTLGYKLPFSPQSLQRDQQPRKQSA